MQMRYVAGERSALYVFDVWRLGMIDWEPRAGIYILASHTFDAALARREKLLYVAQTKSFTSTSMDQETWYAARLLGMTHVYFAMLDGEENRSSIEKDLIAEWRPPLNARLSLYDGAARQWTRH